ncbi:YceH family protein [Pseudomonas sp. MAP12]|uniref:YceH family protein n=1 Tax=Geopseudomonas aromaticivorans TaxID=2849492 RepID=A0ABS6MXD2_9GAMM|nr:YceH family protein [Pseudomonas aromaticivorans]MBV2133462.1 YceH family protein [Pseudomonas aromaticivorans]
MSEPTPTPSPFADAPLSAVEVRALGCLIEKQATTPESYPLTLNALQLACNQKTSREPLMNLQPGEIGQALRSLEHRGLARLVMGSRADRWEQRADKQLELVHAQLILLALLMLRGPQTLGELLARSTRLHAFDDTEEIRHHLERLMARELVIQLPRQSGQREERYAQQLGDPAEQEALLAARTQETAAASGAATAQEDRIAALEARITELEARLARLETGSD